MGVNIPIQFTAKGVNAVQQAVARVNQKLDSVADNAEQIEGRLSKVQERFGQIAATGAVALSPFLLASRQYLATAEANDRVAKKWQQTTGRLEKAQLDLGRKSTEALQPYYDLLADVVEKINEVDPALLEAGIQVGGALSIVGAVGLLATQVVRFTVATVKLSRDIQRAAAGGNRFAQAGLYGAVGAGAVAAGSFIGVEVARGIGDVTGDENLQNASLERVGETIKQLVFLQAHSIFQIIQELEQTWIDIQELFHNIGNEFEGVINEVSRQFQLFIVTLQEVIDDIGGAVGLDVGLSGDEARRERDRINRRFDSLSTGGGQLGFREGSEAQQFQTSLDGLAAYMKLATEQSDEWVREHSANFARVLGIEEERVLEMIEDGKLVNAIQRERDKLLLDAQDEWLTFEQQRERATARANDRSRDVAEAMGLLGDNAEDATDVLQEFDTDLLDNFAALMEERAAAETAFEEDRQQQLIDFQEEMKEIEAEFQYQREQQLANFERQQAQKRTEHEKARAKKQQEFNEEEIERLDEFARERQRAEEDHRESLLDAAARLDALAVFEELRSFDKQEQRAKEDFDQETKQRRKQHEERMKQEADQFQERLQRDQENFDYQMRQNEQNHRRMINQRQQQFNDEQRQQALAFRRDLEAREQQFYQEYQQERRWESLDEQAKAAYYNGLQQQFNEFSARMLSQSIFGTVSNSVDQITNAFSGFGAGFGMSSFTGGSSFTTRNQSMSVNMNNTFNNAQNATDIAGQISNQLKNIFSQL